MTDRSLRTVERTLQMCRKHLSSFLHDHHDPAPAPEHADQHDACGVD